MNGDRKVNDDVQSYIDKALHMQYMDGYHDGRRTERAKLAKSKWLVVKDKDEVRKAALDPCANCMDRTDLLKIGCMRKSTCEPKKKQLLALEILEYFE